MGLVLVSFLFFVVRHLVIVPTFYITYLGDTLLQRNKQAYNPVLHAVAGISCQYSDVRHNTMANLLLNK